MEPSRRGKCRHSARRGAARPSRLGRPPVPWQGATRDRSAPCAPPRHGRRAPHGPDVTLLKTEPEVGVFSSLLNFGFAHEKGLPDTVRATRRVHKTTANVAECLTRESPRSLLRSSISLGALLALCPGRNSCPPAPSGVAPRPLLRDAVPVVESESAGGSPPGRAETHHAHQVLATSKGHLRKRLLELLGFLVAAYLIVRLIPSLREALKSLEHVSWRWVLGAIGLEVLSETGFVVSWRGVVDPEGILGRAGGGHRLSRRAAWTQLGGGMVLPGGLSRASGLGPGSFTVLACPRSSSPSASSTSAS